MGITIQLLKALYLQNSGSEEKNYRYIFCREFCDLQFCSLVILRKKLTSLLKIAKNYFLTFDLVTILFVHSRTKRIFEISFVIVFWAICLFFCFSLLWIFVTFLLILGLNWPDYISSLITTCSSSSSSAECTVSDISKFDSSSFHSVIFDEFSIRITSPLLRYLYPLHTSFCNCTPEVLEATFDCVVRNSFPLYLLFRYLIGQWSVTILNFAPYIYGLK